MSENHVRRNPPRVARNAGHHHLRSVLGDVTNKPAASAWGGPAHGKGVVADASAARSPGEGKRKSRPSATPPSPVKHHADAVVTQLSPQPNANPLRGCPVSPDLRCSPHATKTVLVDSPHAAARPRSAFPSPPHSRLWRAASSPPSSGTTPSVWARVLPQLRECFDGLAQAGVPYIHPTQLRLGRVLGTGAFADVHEALLLETGARTHRKSSSLRVAVKNCEVDLSSSSPSSSPAADDECGPDDALETTGGVAELTVALSELKQEALLAKHASVGGGAAAPRENMMRVLGASYLALPDSGVVELHLVMDLAPGGDLCSFINHPTLNWVELTAANERQYPAASHYRDIDDHGDIYVYTLQWAVKLQLAEQLAQMLCDLAQCGLVHRDIKAANVLLSQPWGTSTSQSPPVLKLTDWGGAERAGVVDQRKQTTGTRGYMAPEIRSKAYRKRRVTPLHGSIDVYAMGVTLLELFAGSVWMGSGDDEAQMDREVEQALERVERVEPAVAPIIRSCLATRPADRLSAEQLLSSLKQLRCLPARPLGRARTVREPPRSPLDAERMLRSRQLNPTEEAQEEEQLVASFRRLNRTGSA